MAVCPGGGVDGWVEAALRLLRVFGSRPFSGVGDDALVSALEKQGSLKGGDQWV